MKNTRSAALRMLWIQLAFSLFPKISWNFLLFWQFEHLGNIFTKPSIKISRHKPVCHSFKHFWEPKISLLYYSLLRSFKVYLMPLGTILAPFLFLSFSVVMTTFQRALLLDWKMSSFYVSLNYKKVHPLFRLWDKTNFSEPGKYNPKGSCSLFAEHSAQQFPEPYWKH